MPDLKTCHRCWETQPLDQFHANRQTRDRKHPYCKTCRSAYFQANKPRYNATQRARQAKWTPERIAVRDAYYRDYYATHRDVLREKARLKREAERAARVPWYATT